MITIKEFEKEMNELEKIQDDVENILNNKNIIVKFFKFRKAIKLHKEAQRRFENLLSKELIADR